MYNDGVEYSINIGDSGFLFGKLHFVNRTKQVNTLSPFFLTAETLTQPGALTKEAAIADTEERSLGQFLYQPYFFVAPVVVAQGPHQSFFGTTAGSRIMQGLQEFVFDIGWKNFLFQEILKQ